MKLFCFLIIILFSAAIEVAAQKAPKVCITNHNAPPINAYYWPPDTNVRVYLARGMFTPPQRAKILEAMKIWSDSSAQTGSGIRFSYAGEIDRPINCSGCLTVTRRSVYKHDRKHYAFFNPLKQNGDGLLLAAWIDFDFATTDAQALQGFMSHELGHGMGLWDCKRCAKKKTIMNGFNSINNDNGLVAPSPCDLEVVRQVYDLQRRVDNNIVVEKRP